jgi:serine/threonine protein kinase
LAENGTVKIVDFGLSKAVMSESDSQTALTAAGQLLGTPHYMSPEQYQAAPLDARTDIYSLGGTFYRLLTGDFPYGQKSIHQIMYAHLQSPPPDPRKLNPEVARVRCADREGDGQIAR